MKVYRISEEEVVEQDWPFEDEAHFWARVESITETERLLPKGWNQRMLKQEDKARALAVAKKML